MSNATNTLAPGGFDEDVVDDQQQLIASVAGNNLPSSVVAYAQQAEGSEGEAVAGVIVIDGSGSMQKVRKAVIEGFNTLRKVLRTSHERRKMHLRVIIFNSKVNAWEPYGSASPFLTPLEGDPSELPEFTDVVYVPYGATALYKAALEGLAAVEILAKEFEDAGYDVRRVIAVISDGFDNMSSKEDLAQLRKAVQRRTFLEKYTFLFYGIIDT